MLPPESRRIARVRAGAAHVVVADRAARRARACGEAQEAAALHAGLAERLQREVLGDRQGADDALVVAVLGDAADAGRDRARGGAAAAFRRSSVDRAVGRRDRAGDQRRERGLAVAGDAGNADDLARAHA